MTLLKLNPTIIGAIQLTLGALAGVGGLIAYSEAKFASREAVQLVDVKLGLEHEQRKTDVARIESAVSSQNDKLDKIWSAVSRR